VHGCHRRSLIDDKQQLLTGIERCGIGNWKVISDDFIPSEIRQLAALPYSVVLIVLFTHPIRRPTNALLVSRCLINASLTVPDGRFMLG